MITPLISFLVTVHNEATELNVLLGKLYNYIQRTPDTEIVILDDYSDNPETQKIIQSFSSQSNVSVIQHRLDGDFGAHKTFGSRSCKGKWIVQLDADEYLADVLLDNLVDILNANPNVELFKVPRVNIVRGMTDADAAKWGWKVYSLPEYPSLPIVNWEFDHQARIYRNLESIRWNKKLHETVVGAKTIAVFPLETNLAIIHDKNIDRQRKQNEFYMTNWSREANMGQG